MKRMEHLYVRFIVKFPVVFYMFLFFFFGVFIFTTYSVKLDSFQSYQATLEGNKIFIRDAAGVIPVKKYIYIYKDRSMRVYKANYSSLTLEDGIVKLTLDNSNLDISGQIMIDLIVDEQTLLERIFIRVGKG